MGTKVIKLGSWDKHPADFLFKNIDVWHMRNGINMNECKYMKHIFELRMKDQIEERSSQLLRNLSSCERKA